MGRLICYRRRPLFGLARLPENRPLVLLSIFFLSVLFVWGQTQPAATGTQEDSGALAARPSGPVDDYIPCLFDFGQQRRMRAVSPDTDLIDYRLADKLVKINESALRAAAIEAFSPSSGSTRTVASLADDIVKQYKSQVTDAPQFNGAPDSYTKLIGMTIKAGSLLVRNAAQTAFKSVYPAGDLSTLNKFLDPAAADWQEVVRAAQYVRRNQTNDDVSCSMALLSWKETSDIFGRRVANTYVGIQVTVRNLNPANEFLIHDIQVAVDTGMYEPGYPSELTRFQAGRDKLLVRNLAQRGQSEDRRNLVLHALQAVGAIAGSSAIAGSRDFGIGVAVFQGAFLPSYSLLFPDHTVDQLNHINDLVFSASSTNKVVVPVQGSVPLVTFISEKPIEQLPFAWCGHVTNNQPSRFCSNNNSSYALGESVTGGTPPWKPLPYKNWKAAALHILAEQTFAVVGGVHIKVVTKEKRLAGLTCPTLPSGAVDISEVSKDALVHCTATVVGVDAPSDLALKKDSSEIKGRINPIPNGNTAELTFKPAELSDGDGDYKLELVDGAGGRTDTGQILRLSIQPFITIDDQDRTIKTDRKLKIKGKHLDQLSEISLVPKQGGNAIKGASKPGGANLAELEVDFSEAKLDAGEYYLRYPLKEPKVVTVDSILITVAPASPPAAQTAPPAAQPPK